MVKCSQNSQPESNRAILFTLLLKALLKAFKVPKWIECEYHFPDYVMVSNFFMHLKKLVNSSRLNLYKNLGGREVHKSDNMKYKF